MILIKCALTELLYLGNTYENEIKENKEEIVKFKSILMNYYIAKETDWREAVRD